MLDLGYRIFGFAGDIPDGQGRALDIQTRYSLEQMPLGRMARVVTGNRVMLPTDGDQMVIGVVVKHDGLAGYVWPSDNELPVVTNGAAFVDADGVLEELDAVYVRFRSDPHVLKVTFSDDFVFGNEIIAGFGQNETSPVAWLGSQAATLEALAVAIKNLESIQSAAVTGARELTITGAEPAVTIYGSILITGGLTQPGYETETISGPSRGTKIGGFRADEDDSGTGPTAMLIVRARCLQSGDAVQAPIVEVNMP